MRYTYPRKISGLHNFYYSPCSLYAQNLLYLTVFTALLNQGMKIKIEESEIVAIQELRLAD